MASSINVPQVERVSSGRVYETTTSPPTERVSSDVHQPQPISPFEEPKLVFKPGISFILAFISICVVTLAAALDATSLSIALPIVTKRLNGTAIQTFWSGTSFLVTSAVIQPVFGGLSHGFGRKQVCDSELLLSLILLMLSS